MEPATTETLSRPVLTDQSSAVQNSHAASIVGRLFHWVSNSFATFLVVLIAIAFGSYLVSSWQFDDGISPGKTVAEVVGAWPQLESCSVEFGDSPFQIQRELAVGSVEDILAKLSADCTTALRSDAQPCQPIGAAESKMIERMEGQTAFQQDGNKWRIYQVVHIPGTSQFPQVVGIRDDCRTTDSENDNDAATWPTSRLVVWGLAIPSGEKSWTTYVGRASAGESRLGFPDSLVPIGARRTMTISDQQNASVVGFSGGMIDEAKSHYDLLARKHQWETVSQWRQNGNNWHASFGSPAESTLEGIQVQLVANHNQPVKGIVTLMAKQNVSQDSKEARE